MGRFIMTYNDLDSLNQFLKEKGLDCSVHMHDLCGSQSFTIKSSGISPENFDDLVMVITNYFEAKRISVKFSENQDFVLN